MCAHDRVLAVANLMLFECGYISFFLLLRSGQNVYDLRLKPGFESMCMSVCECVIKYSIKIILV